VNADGPRGSGSSYNGTAAERAPNDEIVELSVDLYSRMGVADVGVGINLASSYFLEYLI
jgi:hypothetical protein